MNQKRTIVSPARTLCWSLLMGWRCDCITALVFAGIVTLLGVEQTVLSLHSIFCHLKIFVGASNLLHNSNWFVVVFPRSRYPRLRTNAEYEKGAHLQRQKKQKAGSKIPPTQKIGCKTTRGEQNPFFGVEIRFGRQNSLRDRLSQTPSVSIPDTVLRVFKDF